MYLVYTFRTFPWISELQEFAQQPSRLLHKFFVFGKLKEDMKKFCEIIEEEKPEWIIGVARGKTCWEKKAVNKFNKFTIIQDGVLEYPLCIPDNSEFPIREIPRPSFCNWTAYKIADYLSENNLKTKLSFVHIGKKDVQGDALHGECVVK